MVEKKEAKVISDFVKFETAVNDWPVYCNCIRPIGLPLQNFRTSLFADSSGKAVIRPLQGLKTLFCVPTDDLLRAKDDLLSEGGQSLSSLTEQASDKACNQTGTHFQCYN